MSCASSRCLKLLEKCKTMRQLKQAHAQVLTCGLGNDGYALSRVLAFCSDPHQGSLNHAWELFQRIQNPTICICNTMMKAFLHNSELVNTIHLYSGMLRNGMYPDHYTFPCVFKACAKLEYCLMGELVHGCCLKLGLVGDIFVGNALIAMYGGFGRMEAAGYVFDEMPSRCAISWTVMISGYAKIGDIDTARMVFDGAPVKDRGIWGAMISGYVQNNCFKEGLYMFRLMQLAKIDPDESLCVSVLCACANLGAPDIGIWIHRYLDKVRMPLTARLGTALVDMYAKCGNLELAKRVFDGMPQRDTICWNAMISGMAMHGDFKSALKLFFDMEESGMRPDDITFIAVLTACSYSGMADEGLQVLDRMWTVYNTEPKSEHYGCIIDLLGRAGRFEEARNMIERMPNPRNPSEEAMAWRSLMSACCNLSQVHLAEVAAEKLVQLECHSGAYVLLSNLYAAAGKHDDARRIRNIMKERGVDKAPGCSSIEVNGFVFEFIAGEETHPWMEDIHILLEKMNKQLGDSGFDLHQIQADLT